MRRELLRCTRQSGFTLVEVLVAMMVMAIMAVMAWQGVDGIVRTRNASQARLEQTLRLNTVIAQWDRDLDSIQDSNAVPQSVQCDGTTLRMVRRTPDGLQVVAWSLRADDSGGAWVRWAGPAVTTAGQLKDSWQRSQQLQGDEPGSLKTLTGLTGWQVYFYRGNSWTNCQSTGDLQSGTGNATSNTGSAGAATTAANAAATGTPAANVTSFTRVALPNGVRAVLSFAGGAGLSGDLTRDTLLQH